MTPIIEWGFGGVFHANPCTLPSSVVAAGIVTAAECEALAILLCSMRTCSSLATRSDMASSIVIFLCTVYLEGAQPSWYLLTGAASSVAASCCVSLSFCAPKKQTCRMCTYYENFLAPAWLTAGAACFPHLLGLSSAACGALLTCCSFSSARRRAESSLLLV